ncbi:hypothetical protein ACIQC5_02755 [Paenarthrobacter sp. NPDC092416]|uniref:hypothetical protein n=1 Tax=Paenarthrobacter sp. NPDC092416 TaxID=3364386 RepID=UPI0038188C5D
MKRRVAGAARGIAAAVPAALFVAVAGTGLHRQTIQWSGGDLVWGVVVALLLLASVQLWLAAWSRSLIPTAVAGMVSYAAVGVMSSSGPRKQLVLGDLAGNVWVFGIGVTTVVMLLVASRLRLRPAAPGGVAEAAEPPWRQ